VENFGWNFFSERLSEPEGVVLSSAAMVTAAESVHNAGWRASEVVRNSKDRQRTELVTQLFFRPSGACSFSLSLSPGLRRGLHSFAASRLAASL
jgi:hypothetical protein